MKTSSKLLQLLGFFVVGYLATHIVTAQSPKAIMPSGSKVLSLPEYRWCRSELLRLEGEATEVDRSSYWEILDYNDTVKRYRSICSGKQTSKADSQTVTQELTPSAKHALQEAGKRRFIFRRIAREDRRVHVATTEAPVHQHTTPGSTVLVTRTKWQEAYVTGDPRDSKVEIEWLSTAEPKRRITGWIDEQSLARGSGDKARSDYCQLNKGEPPEPDEFIRGTRSSDRFMLLQIRNPSRQDAYVKLLNSNNSVFASFLVPPNNTRTINGLPQDTYSIAFSTGSEFSRGCDSFVSRAYAGFMQKSIVYDTHTTEWRINLNIPDSKSHPIDRASHTIFEKL